MQTIRLWMLVTYVLVFAVSPVVSAAPVRAPESGLELRVAANPGQDPGILGIAGDRSQTMVYRAGRLVAKWVPVLTAKAAEFTGDPAFVVRENGDGQTELLVLIGPNDLIGHVQRVRPGLDSEGRIAAVVEFDREGSARLPVLTEENEGRHLAQIIGGVIYGAPSILGVVYYQMMITGDFTEAEIAEMATALGASGSFPGPSVKCNIQLACLAALVAAGLFIFALGLLPAPGLKPSTHPRVWSVGMAACGGVIGGLWLGVGHEGCLDFRDSIQHQRHLQDHAYLRRKGNIG